MVSMFLTKLALLAAIMEIAYSAGLYETCAGEGYPTLPCNPGLQCFRRNKYYSSCQPSCPLGVGWECEFASSNAGAWDQCAGDGWGSLKQCPAGYACYARTTLYSQCRPINDCPLDWRCYELFRPTTPAGPVILPAYSRCGHLANSVCASGTTCFRSNDLYSECRPSCPLNAGWHCESHAGALEQCAGNGWANAKQCPSGYACHAQTTAYSECRPSCPLGLGWRCESYAGALEQCAGNGWANARQCPSGYACYPQTTTHSECRLSCPLGVGWRCESYAGALEQCAGNGWANARQCPSGYSCYPQTTTYSECRLSCPLGVGWHCESHAGAFEQCAGNAWANARQCPSGYACYAQTTTYSQCRPVNDCPLDWRCYGLLYPPTTVAPGPGFLAAYAQCNNVGNAVCVSGTACFRLNADYAECRSSCPASWVCNTDVAGVNQYCGGQGYVGLTRCAEGLRCFAHGSSYSKCAAECPGDGWIC